MTKLEELINELCPNGVEYKKIGDVCDILRGKRLTKKELSDEGKYPVLHGGSSPMGYYNEYNRKANTTVVVNTGNAGSVFFYDKEFWSSDACFSIYPKDCLRDKFIFFFLSSNEHKLKNRIRYGAMPTIDSLAVETIKIPVPPLEVQDEIVKYLDNFTELTAELTAEITAELTARQKQYAFYRDYLLDFSDEDVTKKIPDIDCSQVKTLRLDEVAQIYDGTHQTPNYKDSGIPFISVENIKDIYGSKKYISEEDFNKYKIKPQINDVFMTRIGSIGDCAILDKQADLAYYVSLALIRPNTDIVISKYLKYVIESRFGRKELRKRTLVNAVPIKINKNDIGKIELPIPPLSVQENIVKILDRFDKLNNDMSEGLPAEIEARKKQYEYYRDTLLSFDDKACSQIVKVERERELSRVKTIKWLELQDVLKIKNGKDYKSFNTGNYPVYGSGGIMAYVDTFAYDKPSVLIPRKGSIDKLYYVDVPFWNVDTIFYTDINNEIVLTKYLYYWLQKEHLEKLNTAGGVPSLTQTVLNKVKIAVPPLEEQERIVSILDRFDKLCNDISEGLPAEIEARQKQYEYYRDKLLTFKEKIVY